MIWDRDRQTASWVVLIVSPFNTQHYEDSFLTFVPMLCSAVSDVVTSLEIQFATPPPCWLVLAREAKSDSPGTPNKHFDTSA